ncbi:MAG TPA: DUF389 domain-containing protein [Acidimicrobiales bacterium]|nr:DUF389 domain-containing protein [Acidimicrobiales bacterium]
MQRAISISVPSSATQELIAELEGHEHVTALSVAREASVKPPGDVVTVHALERGSDAVLAAAQRARRHGPVSVATEELLSVADPDHHEQLVRDLDEGLWEEAVTGLGHRGRATVNFFVLIVAGGVIALTGLLTETNQAAVAFVAAAIIAPGFEPLAKIPLGLVLHRRDLVQRGLRSTATGYLALTAAAAIAYLGLRAGGVVTETQLVSNSEVRRLADPGVIDVVVSAAGALTGMIMEVANRRNMIAGPLIALALIPAAALVGAAVGAGQGSLALEALLRLALDFLLIVVFGAAVVAYKQARVHHRPPME